MVRLTDSPDMTLDVYCGRKTTKQQHFHLFSVLVSLSVIFHWCISNEETQIKERYSRIVIKNILQIGMVYHKTAKYKDR